MDSIDIGIYISYAFLVISIGAAVFLPLVHAIKHPQGLMKSLLGIGGLVVLFVVSYALSGSELSAKAVALGVDESGSKLIGAGLTLFYLIFVIALGGIVYSEISKALK